MKRPWLISSAGMRLSMVLGFVLSILLIWPAIEQVRDETRVIEPFDRTNVTYCELSACGHIEGLGLEVVYPPSVVEGEYGTEVFVQVINKGRLSGEREFWAELRTSEGKFVEAMRGDLVLTDQGPQFIRFFFTGKKAEYSGLIMDFGS